MTPIISQTIATALIIIFIVSIVTGIVFIKNTKKQVVLKNTVEELCTLFLLMDNVKVFNSTHEEVLYIKLPHKIMNEKYRLTSNGYNLTFSSSLLNLTCEIGMNTTGSVTGGLITLHISDSMVIA